MIDFNRLIEKHLAREKRPKQQGRYYPSEIASCLRKLWYSYKQPKDTPMDAVKVFEVGNLLHDFMAEVLRSERNPEIELLQSELPFELREKGFIVSGRVDDVLIVRADQRKLLVEVKSTKSLYYLEKPSPQHVMQLQLYMHATGIHDGAVVYVEKNTLQAKEFFMKYDSAVAERALRRFAALHEALGSSKIPVPEARLKKPMNWMCKTCDWRDECWKETPDRALAAIPIGKWPE
jgi:CRISPR/Cas system-associated exonuclease Cas4 (RecB family)